ncbi:MAG: MFS transporter [Pseudomonadota bacterium]|nr:MFS transporter [Pseudomonadota bacterium]
MAAISGYPAIIAAFSERNYRTYSVGNILSHNGTWAQRTAVLWFTWEMTESGLWLGLMTVADLLPVVVVGPLAGAIADRVNLLNMMKITQIVAVVQSAALAGLTFAGVITPELLLLLVFAHGIILSFNQPARLAMVPHLIKRENLSAAIGINSMIFNSARATGPMISGALIGGWGIAFAFLFNALSYVWFIGSLFLLRVNNPRSTKARTPMREVPREIVEGFRYAIQHFGISRVLVILSVVSIFGRPYMELLAGFADEVFGRGAAGYALMVSMTGIGAVIGGFWLAQRGHVKGLMSRVVLALLLLGLALIGFAATNLFFFALVCLLITGFAVIVIGVGEQTLLQNAVDPAMRGRVMSLYGMIGRGLPAIGALIMGSLAEIFGFQIPVLVGAIVLLALWWWARERQSAMCKILEL